MDNAYLQVLHTAMPEVIVVVAALLALMLDVSLLREKAIPTRLRVTVSIASFGCVAAAISAIFAQTPSTLPEGVFVSSPVVTCIQLLLLGLTVAVLCLSVDSNFTEHVGEFVLVAMLGTVGMMFLVSSQNLLMIFLSLELLSLSLYVLTGFDRRNPHSSEAALKYFLFGGMSAAFLLYGFSLLYGMGNSLELSTIAAALGRPGTRPLVMLAIATTAIGFGFKTAAAPFHFWTPDVYEGAPGPAAAFIGSASKLASFYAFFLVMTVAFSGYTGSAHWLHLQAGWTPVVAAMATLSMIVGNLGAVMQTGLRRLLAYSAIAHTGYMLIGIVSHTQQGLAALLYYVVTYGVSVVGIFAVVGVVESTAGDDRLERFDGLSRRDPWIAGCLLVLVLSQAGIPPLSGFFAKFFVFVAAAANPGLLWLIILALAMSAVSLYYYLRVLKRVFVAEPPAQAQPLSVPLLSRTVICGLALATLLLGCLPEVLLHWFTAAIAATSAGR